MDLDLLKKVIHMEQTLANRAALKTKHKDMKDYFLGEAAAFKRMLWILDNLDMEEKHCEHAFNLLRYQTK